MNAQNTIKCLQRDNENISFVPIYILQIITFSKIDRRARSERRKQKKNRKKELKYRNSFVHIVSL